MIFGVTVRVMVLAPDATVTVRVCAEPISPKAPSPI